MLSTDLCLKRKRTESIVTSVPSGHCLQPNVTKDKSNTLKGCSWKRVGDLKQGDVLGPPFAWKQVKFVEAIFHNNRTQYRIYFMDDPERYVPPCYDYTMLLNVII